MAGNVKWKRMHVSDKDTSALCRRLRSRFISGILAGKWPLQMDQSQAM